MAAEDLGIRPDSGGEFNNRGSRSNTVDFDFGFRALQESAAVVLKFHTADARIILHELPVDVFAGFLLQIEINILPDGKRGLHIGRNRVEAEHLVVVEHGNISNRLRLDRRTLHTLSLSLRNGGGHDRLRMSGSSIGADRDIHSNCLCGGRVRNRGL